MALLHGSTLGGMNPTKLRVMEMRPLVGHSIDLGLIRRLYPWNLNRARQLDKDSKFYFRDTGLLHCLCGRRTLASVRADAQFHGSSWEGYCIEGLALAAQRAPLSYYRENEEEVDLVIEISPAVLWALEIKGGKAVPRSGFHKVAGAIGAKRKIVVRPVSETILRDDYDVMPLRLAMAAVRDAVGA